MKGRTKQLILACTVPILILIGMCVTPLYTLMYGSDILLQTKPMDPSNPFRGDYISLQYQAEDIPVKLISSRVLKEVQNGKSNFNVYVSFEKKNGIDTPLQVTLDKPSKGVFLKGMLTFIDDNLGEAYIQYNLDKYYVEDNTGKSWGNASSKGEIVAKIKVKNGYGMLIDIQRSK